jgi:hypothetical protein
MNRVLLAAALAAWLAAPTFGADPPMIDRTIGKEPKYQTKSPKYGLLVFGPDGADRVWLVQDGDTLYVDRNGNGDLTDAGDKVPAKKPREGVKLDEGEYTFAIGDLTVGGKTHKGFTLMCMPLANLSHVFKDYPAAEAQHQADPKAAIVRLDGEVEVPGLKGGGVGGRVAFYTALIDMGGGCRLADKPADAPVFRMGGPLEITFDVAPPTLRVGRSSEFALVVGTPGVGPGTFTAVGYMDTIPESAKPTVEIEFRPAKAGDPPAKEKYEIKERC